MLLPLAPVSLIVQLFDAFLAFSLLFGSFFLYVQEGSAASIQGDMQIEAAARLKSTLSDLLDLDMSRNISFGAPPRIFLWANERSCIRRIHVYDQSPFGAATFGNPKLFASQDLEVHAEL